MPLMKPLLRGTTDDSLIPMINIVFLLLIFFMIAGQIQNSMPADILLPEGETGTPADNERVQLYFSADGSLSVDGEKLTLAQLDEQLVQSKRANWALVADKTVTAKQLDSVLRQLQKVGVMSLKLMTQRTDLTQ